MSRHISSASSFRRQHIKRCIISWIKTAVYPQSRGVRLPKNVKIKNAMADE